MRMDRRAALLDPYRPRVLTVQDLSWSKGHGVDYETHTFTLGGDYDIYAAITGRVTDPLGTGGEDRMQYSVRISGLQANDRISFDWDARNYTTVQILGTIIISNDITTSVLTTGQVLIIKAAKTNGPGHKLVTYDATDLTSVIDLNMRLGTASDDRCYIWLNNILVNGIKPVIVSA